MEIQDPKLPSLDQSKIEEDKTEVLVEESKENSSLRSIIEQTSPKLLAWCSAHTNKVSIMDLETKEEYTSFNGAKISNSSQSWTHVKEIPNKRLLVSLHQSAWKSANMEVFDISKKGFAKKIYSFAEDFGAVSDGDIAYHVRRNILGTVSLEKRVAYHLFTIDNDIVKLNRKSKWPPQYSINERN